MSELRLGRPAPLLSTEVDETDGMYLDSRTALRQDVLGVSDTPEPKPPKLVARLEEPTQAQSAVIPFSFPGSLGTPPAAAAPAARAKQQTEQSAVIPFAFPGSLSEPATQPETQKPDDSGDASRGFSAALNQTPALLKGAVGFAGATGEKAFGEGGVMTALKKYGLEGYQKGMAEIGERAKDTDSATTAWEKAKGGDLGALVDWVQYGFGYLGGNIVETAATALLGGAVGTMAAPGAGTVAGAASGVVGKEAVKGVARNLIEGLVTKEATRLAAGKVATEEVTRQATKNVARNIGSTVALAGSGITKSTGGVFGEAVEEAGTDNLSGFELSRVFGAGVVAGLTEAVVDKLGVDAALGRINIPGGGRAGRSLIGAAGGVGLEGGTELFQTAIERAGAGKALTGEEAMREYIDSFALGALGGGTIGGVTGAFRSGRNKDVDRIKQMLDDAQTDLTSDDGRQELFNGMMGDERMAQILQANGIESGDDPRFQSVVTKALSTQRLLLDLEAPTPEEREASRKQKQEDVQAAFGDTASTGVGVGTGATEPVIRRDSVTPNEETRTLEGDAQPAILPESETTPAGTVAMSGEDLASRVEGFEVMPAFQVGDKTVGNRFATQPQAESFLFGKKNKETGQREGGYASTVEGTEFQIRQGKRSKEAGGGTFFFIEGRAKPTASAQVDAAANETNTAPTEKQKASGTYKKGRTKIAGVNIAIENPRGSVRSGKSPDGKSWENNMAHHYGYVSRTKGKDGDQVDVFIGPNPESNKVFVVDQKNPDGSFDEHKAMLGFDSIEEARAGYLANYTADWQGLGEISEMPVEAFKSWVKDGTKRKPVAYKVPATATAAPATATAVTPAAEAAPAAPQPKTEKAAQTGKQTKKAEPQKTVEQTLKDKAAAEKAAKAEADRVATEVKEAKRLAEEAELKRKTKERAKAEEKKKQAEADKAIGKKTVPQSEIIEIWEDNDDTKTPHIPWANLSKEAKEQWTLAVEGGYVTNGLESMERHDAIVNTELSRARAKRASAKAKASREADDIGPVLRLSNQGGGGITVQALTDMVAKFKENWANVPEVRIVATEQQLPAKLLGSIVRGDAQGTVSGIYYKGRVYLVAENISGFRDAVVTVQHEVAGHFGLRSILGEKHADTMLDIYNGNRSVRKAADAMMVKEGLTKEVAVEEVLADMAESGRYPQADVQSALQKIYTAIRTWLRDTFKIKFVSDAELKQIVANARRFVEDGTVEEGKGGTAAADKSIEAATARQQTATFYSAMERAFRGAKLSFDKNGAVGADQWKAWLASKGPEVGVKKDEVEWTGINDWLDLQAKEKLTKQQVLDWIAGNRVYVNEVVLSDANTMSPGETEETFVYREPTEDEIRDFVRDQIDDRTRDWEIETEDQGLDVGSEMMPDELTVSPDDMDNAALRDWVAANFGWQNYMQMHRLDMERFQRGRVKKATKPRHTRGSLVLPGGRDHAELVLFDPTIAEYKSTDDTHFGDITKGRTIGWLRMNVRQDINGNDVLFLEELQSQRGQDGRKKGFKSKSGSGLPDGWQVFEDKKNGWYVVDNSNTQVGIYADTKESAIGYAMMDGVPDGPFVKDTKAWTSLLLKRAIAYAQKEGISRIAWTRGEQQNQRYDLKKRVDEIVYVKVKGEDRVELTGMKDGKEIFSREIPKNQLAAFVGDGMAKQIENNDGLELDNEIETSGVISGEDIEVGNVDLRPYYDQTVPSVAKAILKSFGGTTEIMQIDGTGEQIGFVIPEKLQQTVAGDGLPMFRRKDYESQFDDLDPKTRQMALAKGSTTPPTIAERLDALKPKMWLRVVQGTFDKFRSVKDVDMKAYMQLRLSNSPQDGAVTGLLHYGQVFNDDGALNIKKGTKGLLDILKPVGAETDRFLMWIAANRAEQLAKEDRERFFTKEEITGLKRLNVGTMKDGKPRASVYAEALQNMNALNRSVLDVSKSAGLIDDAAYKKFAADIWYVPFYRQMDDDRTLSAAQTSSGSVGQYMSKKLRGSERQLNDLMENVLLNWSHILSASMKNQAAVATLKSATELGDVVTKLKTQEKGAVKVMEGGKETFYRIDDEFLLASLDSVASMPSYGMFTNIAREFKTTLTRFISLSPTFKINNLIRDSIQSIGLTELEKNPITNVMQGFSAYKDERAEALVGGGLFAMGNAFDGDQAANVKRLLKAGVPADQILTTQDKAVAFMKGAWDKYDEFSDALENSNRLALYQQLRARGVTHMEASYAARDLQDFSLQGNWAAVRYLSQVVPYFNARLQGMYKLGRDGLDPVAQVLGGDADASTRQKAAKFSAVLGAVTLFGVGLYLANKDDEEYKKLEDWQRDSFFWIRLPGTDKAVRIPKPFEMGAFATIMERLVEQMVDDKVEGKVFGQRLKNVILENLAMDPMPQIFKPLYDLARNKDGFTDRPIESMGMERLSKQSRVNAGTSAAAVGLGKVNDMFADFASAATGGAVNSEAIQLSPIQIDYLVRGYLGWLGASILTTSNIAVAPLKAGESSRFERIDDLLVVGNYVKSLPQGQSRYVTSFYENAKVSAMATADYQNFIKLGQFDKAKELAGEKKDAISLNKLYTKMGDTMSTISKQIKLVEDDAKMPGDVKRTEIEKLQQLRIEYAKRAEEARLSRKEKD